MKNSLTHLLLVFTIVFSFSCTPSGEIGEVEMPKFFNNNMVFQRHQPIRIWGKGVPGQKVVVQFDGVEKTNKIAKDGTWQVVFDPLPASGPFELEVNGQKFYDIQVGDVWVAGGQSNMEWVLSAQVEGLQQELSDAEYPLIRFFKIPHDYDAKPKFDVRGGEWRKADSDNILNFSAVAWFFAKQVHLEQGVPIGIIESNWGGTPAEGWTKAEELLKMDFYKEKAKDVLERKDYWIQEVIDNKVRELTRNDLVLATQNGEIQGVANPNFDDGNWELVKIPEDNPFSDIAWFRKTFTIEDKQNLKINLGDIQQIAHVYLNGGRLFFKDYGDLLREFPIPSSMLNIGENTLALRVVNTWNNQVRLGKSDEIFLRSGSKKISLEGDWKYNNSIEESLPVVEKYNWLPGMMFNAMIAPIVKYPIRGVIWYQGESNADDHVHYRELFSTLIYNWRAEWEIGDFPFLFVQLANFMERNEVQPDSNWAYLREAQTQTLDLPNTGMAVTIDIGNANDIHPRNKRDVGLRLWRAANKIAYGQDVVYSGPVFQSFEFEENGVILKFDHVAEGLTLSSGKEIKGFIVRGQTDAFFPANVKLLDNDKVLVSHPQVGEIREIRYAWADNPEVNLYNSEGLPAVPFRISLDK
jgi:sialate O-acetylesterase